MPFSHRQRLQNIHSPLKEMTYAKDDRLLLGWNMNQIHMVLTCITLSHQLFGIHFHSRPIHVTELWMRGLSQIFACTSSSTQAPPMSASISSMAWRNYYVCSSYIVEHKFTGYNDARVEWGERSALNGVFWQYKIISCTGPKVFNKG